MRTLNQAEVRSAARTQFLLPAMQILLFSIAVQAFFLLTARYCVPGGAGDFIAYAWALMGGSVNGVGSSSREIGYPLMMILSGLFATKSLIGLTILQSLMAVTMPLAIYASLIHASERWAYVTAMISAATLAPILFVKWIHHDQAYVFFSALDLWLFIRFVVHGRPRDLYLLTLAVLGASLIRPAGNLLFPLMIGLAYVIRRGPIRHYAAVVAIFLVVMGLNGVHRYDMFVKGRPVPLSYTGQQLFYNLYMNSAEYGITLGPELGPDMRTITDIVHEKMLPDPRDSATLAEFSGIRTASPEFRDKVLTPFYEKYFFPFTADEFSRQLYRQPNWEYYWLMCLVVDNDPIFVRASWEIFRAHPIFAVKFTLRNLWRFMYNPGWFHTRYNVTAIFQGGLFFPPDGQEAIGGTVASTADGLPNLGPAQREASFDTLGAQPRWIRTSYAAVRSAWLGSYHRATLVLFWLMIAAWAAVLVHWIARLGWRPAVRLSDALSTSELHGPIVGISVFFLYNALVTCAFAEPDYRYHHLILPVRVVLAGFGAIVGWRAIRSAMALWRSQPLPVWAELATVRFGQSQVAVAAILMLAMYGSWAWYMTEHAAAG